MSTASVNVGWKETQSVLHDIRKIAEAEVDSLDWSWVREDYDLRKQKRIVTQNFMGHAVRIYEILRHG